MNINLRALYNVLNGIQQQGNNLNFDSTSPETQIEIEVNEKEGFPTIYKATLSDAKQDPFSISACFDSEGTILGRIPLKKK